MAGILEIMTRKRTTARNRIWSGRNRVALAMTVTDMKSADSAAGEEDTEDGGAQ